MVYVIALTSAKFRTKNGFLAKVTLFGRILIPENLAKYVRKGRVWSCLLRVGDLFV